MDEIDNERDDRDRTGVEENDVRIITM